MKKTVIIGATENQERKSFTAFKKLKAYGEEIVLIGNKKGFIEGVEIQTGFPEIDNVHTVTMYISEKHQAEYAKYIVGLKPERVIFNPGSENADLELFLKENNIPTERECTLVKLSLGIY